MRSSTKGRFFSIIKLTTALIIVFFIVKYIKSNADALKDFQFEINFYFLILSFFILLLYLFNQFILWFYITKKNKCNLAFSTTIFLRSYSEFGKYVPGKVFGYAILFHEYSKGNKSKVQLSFSMFLELLASVLSAALLFIISLFLTDIQEFKIYRFTALALLILFFILINPCIINYFTSWIFKITSREPVMLDISYLDLIKMILFYAMNFMIFGFSFMLFIKSFYDVSFSDYPFITGTTAAAGLIGLLAVFVPAGLGVREGIVVFALKFIIPPYFAGIISLTSRIWIIFGELFLYNSILLYLWLRSSFKTS